MVLVSICHSGVGLDVGSMTSEEPAVMVRLGGGCNYLSWNYYVLAVSEDDNGGGESSSAMVNF